MDERLGSAAWTPEEMVQFRPLEVRWTERAKFSITVPKLVEQWANFVTAVERGYGENRVIEEYWNDLDTRKLLQEALDSLPTTTAERLLGEVAPWDARFRDSTVETEPALWTGGWWASRVPKNPVPYFAEEIRRQLASRSRS